MSATLCVNNFVWEGDTTPSGWFHGYHQNREAWLSNGETYMIVRGLDGFWVYEAQTGRIFAWTQSLKTASDACQLHKGGHDFPNPINRDPSVPIERGTDPEWRFFK